MAFHDTTATVNREKSIKMMLPLGTADFRRIKGLNFQNLKGNIN